jgi:hypothetical protein
VLFRSPSYGEVSDGLFSEAVLQLNSKIRERDQVLQKYTTESDEVKLIDKEIAQRKSYLVESINNTRRKLLGRQDELFIEIEEQKSSFDGVPEEESTLQELTRNYFLFEKVYSFLIEKRTEAIITRQVNVSFNKVLEAAPLPIEALSPHKNIVWAIAMLFGLILGIVLAYVRHFIRPSINTPNDIIPNSSIPVIGQVEKLLFRFPSRVREYGLFKILQSKYGPDTGQDQSYGYLSFSTMIIKDKTSLDPNIFYFSQ